MKIFLGIVLATLLGFCNGNIITIGTPQRTPLPVTVEPTFTVVPPPSMTPTYPPSTPPPPPTMTPVPTSTGWQPPNTDLPNVTPTVDPTPTQEVVVINQPINQNPYFNEIGDVRDFSNRIQAIPRGWDYVYNVGSVGLHPFIFDRPNGYVFEISFVNGWWGFSQNIPLQVNQLYLIKVVYAEQVSLNQGNFQDNPLYFSGFIAGNNTLTLPNSDININSGGQNLEALWVIKPARNFLATIEIWFTNLYPSYEGSLTIRSIEIIPVPNNYTNNFLEVE